MAEASKALVIIPTYNESENIERIIGEVFKHTPDIHILVVDDNSPDGTANLVKALQKKHPTIHILEREKKDGLGQAYLAGFKFALQNGYEYIFEMDADFSHDPKEIPNFLKAIDEADLVLGSRYIRGVNVVNWPLQRLLLSYFANVYTRFVTGMPVRDATGGYKCFRKEVLEKIDFDRIHSSGYAFQIELTYKAWRKGFRVKEIPIIFVDRVYGQSKLSRAIMWEAMFLVWKLRLSSLFHKR
ncbi:MAG TPA: polyprenol monophosphomannose synthase [Caldithrix abyssi]|uniref:Polyprenol monophosphomannose synthase n=1 Tax=Caldithrix abyssi TaxID=187145 RepID=A0A7V4U0L7_CALAY|nr:polyprenol monophosphomannose synthase [Caldithrix abyssi]